MAYIIGTPDFIKNLDGWLFKNEQRYAEYILKNKNGIPPMFTTVNQTLYRGMKVDKDFIEKMTSPSGIKLHAHSSWSKDKKLAMKFAVDPDAKLDKKTAWYSIIIEKKITPSNVILDIHNFCMFMGEAQLTMLGLDESSFDSAVKESEVLIKKGLVIKKKDVKLV